MKKYINDEGKVGVIVSPGLGAGWSTWDDNREYLCMDKTLVEMKLRNATVDEVSAHIKNEKGEAPYMGGWNKAKVEWLEKDTPFFIDEYDGSESIMTTGLMST